jgi:predicted nuclease with TOPRIM domain
MELKAAYDAVVAAQAEAQQIAQEIEALFEAGKTDEALALQEKFQAAKAKMEQIKALYDEMAGTVNSDVAKRFVPVSKPKEEEKGEEPKAMSRAAYNALPTRQRLEFAKSGGKLIDEEK